MAGKWAEVDLSTHALLEQPEQPMPTSLEVADGDLVRCAIAPYLFRARTVGGSLLLEPAGAGGSEVDFLPTAASKAGRSSRRSLNCSR